MFKSYIRFSVCHGPYFVTHIVHSHDIVSWSSTLLFASFSSRSSVSHTSCSIQQCICRDKVQRVCPCRYRREKGVQRRHHSGERAGPWLLRGRERGVGCAFSRSGILLSTCSRNTWNIIDVCAPRACRVIGRRKLTCERPGNIVRIKKPDKIGEKHARSRSVGAGERE